MGYPQALSSRLIPRSSLSLSPTLDTTENTLPIVKAIRSGLEISHQAGKRHTFYIIFAPPTTTKVRLDLDARRRKTSVNPVWYDSLWLVLYTGGFDYMKSSSSSINRFLLSGSWDVNDDPSISHAVFKNVHYAMNPLRALTSESGAYFNEVHTSPRPFLLSPFSSSLSLLPSSPFSSFSSLSC